MQRHDILSAITKAAAAIILAGLFGCARAPIKSVEQAMRPTTAPKIGDDLKLVGLGEGLASTIAHLEKHPREMWFGPKRISSYDYVKALKKLEEALRLDPTGDLYFKTLNEFFEFHEVYGDKRWGEVFVTGYFEPFIEGRAKKTKKYNYPIYPVPNDLLRVDLNAFRGIGPAWDKLVNTFKSEVQRDGFLRGQITQGDDGRAIVLPLPSRKEIDTMAALKKLKPLAWVDPVDAFFLHIQGSGTIRLSKKQELRVGYADQNGHPYVPIGKFLKDIIPIEEMSSHRIEQHLRGLPPKEAQRLMNENPSYVFFNKLETAPITAMGVEAVPGRSIATDVKYFPKGALAFLEFEKPAFESVDSIQPEAWVKTGRFVLDHDTGGAIRGPHRVDLFWGRGIEAKQASGVMRQTGRLYYLMPKD